MRRATVACTQHRIDARRGETYCIGRVNGGRRGALHPKGTTAENCCVAVNRGATLTIMGIPERTRRSLGLQAVEVVRYVGRNRRGRLRDLVEFQDGRRFSLTVFALEGVSVCVGLADFLRVAHFS